MKTKIITIKGKRLTLIDADRASMLGEFEYRQISEGIFLYIRNLQWRDVFELLGYDYDKADGAYPEPVRWSNDWFDRRIRYYDDHPFWYYGDNEGRIFGHALWKNDMLSDLCDIVRAELARKFFEDGDGE